MRILLYRLTLFIRSLFFTLSRLSFVLLILLVGFYGFYINDQGQDMMAAFTFLNIFTHTYLFLSVCFLVIWSGIVWNVSRILLGAANLRRIVEEQVDAKKELPDNVQLRPGLLIATFDPNYKRMTENMVRWLPRTLAMIPYAIFVLAYFKQGRRIDVNIIIVLVVAILHLFYLTFRKPLARLIGIKRLVASVPDDTDDQSYDTAEEKQVWKAVRKSKVYFNTWLSLILSVIVFIYALNAAFSLPTDPGRPGLIILSALIVYTMVGLVINIYSNRYRLPLFLLLVLFALLASSRYNNNHHVQVLKHPEDSALVEKRKTDTLYFSQWLQQKIKDSIYNPAVDSNVIFLVAAEGGGIRNTYWTFQVLNALQNRYPAFYNKTFIATGASGGSIGLGFFYSFLYQNRTEWSRQYTFTPKQQQHLDTICSADYLSRVTFAFLYPDLLQRFLPWRINAWDRGSYLANSFDDAYSKWADSLGQSLLSHNYLSMWSDSNAYKFPVLLFNTIYNERGSKALFSPFRLSPRYYADALDILTVTKAAVPIKEAMVSSARFPVITSPGLLTHKRNDTIFHLGHISDGGGFDNTAIQTVQQTAVMIKEQLKKKGYADKFKLVIVYIGYGQDPLVPEDVPAESVRYDEPLGSTYELAPIIGSYNAIFRWIYSGHGLTIALDSTLNVIDFGLRNRFDSTTHQLPLGWYLSPTSKKMIRDEISTRDSTTPLGKSFQQFRRLVLQPAKPFSN